MKRKPWRFHADAYDEMLEAARWYEGQAGIGVAYLAAVQRTVAELGRRPFGLVVPGVPTKLGVRRVFVRTFPYAVVFVEVDDEYVVLAVAHLRRKPGYWLKRTRRR